MKKNYILLILLLVISKNIYSNENILNEFITLNNAFAEKSLYAKQELIVYKDNDVVEKKDAYSFFCDFSQLTYFDNNYFLGTNYGYWIMNNKMKTPLKVSGNYQVQEIEIQDILRIDYKKDYKVITNENGIITLERTNKKNNYPYLSLEKVGINEYKLIFLDKSKKQVKEVIYTKGVLNNENCFIKILITDLIFNKDKKIEFITLKIENMNLPNSLFNQNQMNNLILYIKSNGLIKE